MNRRDVTTMDDEFRTYVAEPDGPSSRRFGYHVRVKDPDGIGIGAEIWIDGERLHYVKRYVVDVGMNRATEVTVTFNAESVNRDEGRTND